MRKQVRLPKRVMAERRYRASQLFEMGRASAHRGAPVEAAQSMRLAIAFDPWNDDFRRGFADIQVEVHKVRAEQLLEEAGALDSSAKAEALRLLEDALQYRPADAELYARAATAANEVGELDRAGEHIASACELQPEEPSHHVLRARWHRRRTEIREAKQAINEALRLDRNHGDAKAFLAELLKHRK